MKKKPIPTEPYPRILWYQEKRKPCTPEERYIIFKRYLYITEDRLFRLFPNSHNIDIHRLAEEKANVLVDSEINLPTIIRKVVVDSGEDHRLTKQMLENSDSFIKWFQE